MLIQRSFNLPKDHLDELNAISNELHTNTSVIVRLAIAEKLASLEREQSEKN